MLVVCLLLQSAQHFTFHLQMLEKLQFIKNAFYTKNKNTFNRNNCCNCFVEKSFNCSKIEFQDSFTHYKPMIFCPKYYLAILFQWPAPPRPLPSAKLPWELFNPFHSSHLPASARSPAWTLTATSSRTSWWTTPASAPATRRQTPTLWTPCPPVIMPRRSAAETRSAARRWTPSPGAAPSNKISALWQMCKYHHHQFNHKVLKPCLTLSCCFLLQPLVSQLVADPPSVSHFRLYLPKQLAQQEKMRQNFQNCKWKRLYR